MYQHLLYASALYTSAQAKAVDWNTVFGGTDGETILVVSDTVKGKGVAVVCVVVVTDFRDICNVHLASASLAWTGRSRF